MINKGASGGKAVVYAETSPGLVEMRIHGVLGDTQFAGDLL